ncbi:tetratricopeptide repeat protein [Streptomyces niveiscabiei]|uniref:trypsin-like peptidase domain-containing protein n=1 Tax=Streptomyces niveiscabiei TaxID=164115 RepID=UPI0029B1015D|nr:tetratricopeptide repeat protein [Streptomyces niveiscabiei]MDX3386360.1 tetratricopeptide repeat protein [Streptomyces niveiscabiei]
MPDRLRTALVEAAGQGSGLVLAPRLVLTAAHVLRERTHATVRTPRTPPVRCEVVWSRSDRHYDAALLLAEEDILPGVEPVRWGTPVTSEPAGITLLGFAAGAGDQVGSRPFRGELDPLDAVERDRYVLNLTGTPPEGASPWAGLSGGAVWCGDLLLGVAVADLPGWQHSRLEAVPAYVLLADPGFRNLLRQHTGQDAPLEPAEFADRAQPSAPLVPASVALLLHPRAETVRFTGRADLLAELTAWCTDGDGVSLALLTGAGGAGKSRVARELGHRLAASRHAVVHLSRNAVPDALFASTTSPVLLVVDYAESRVEQLGALLEIVARRPRAGALRILLIARAQGRWWDELRASGPEAADLAENARRWSITGTESLGADVFRTAVTDLARGVAALGLPVASAPWEEPAKPPRTVLEIHMAALASLLAPSAGTAAQDTLLRHEAAYWKSTSQAPPLNLLGEAALRNAVVTATLVGPVPRERAHTLLARVPRIGDQPEAVRRAVADWLRDLYPSTAYWGVLEPDPLGEYLVGTRVVDEPEIFLRLIDVLDNEEMVNALLVLSRASARVEGVAEVVYDAVRAAPGTLAPRLLGAVRRSAEPAVLVGALEVILDEELLPDEQLVELAHRMPLLSQALISLSVRLQQRVVDGEEATSPLARAGSLHNLAGRLVAAGRHEEALATTATALALLDTAPDAPAWLRGLLLGQRCRSLNESGRPEDSVREGERALQELSRWKEPEDPDVQVNAVAATLNNLSYGLADIGRFDEALARARASVALRRELADRDPEALPDLARSLSTLSRHQRRAGDLEGALGTAEESLRVRRTAAEEEPDAYLTELDSTLEHLAQILADLDDVPALRRTLREVLPVRRLLARTHPEAYLSDHAETLLIAAHVTEGAESLEAADEAVTVARRLVRDQGREHLHVLGLAFQAQARSLAGSGNPHVAFRVNAKAVQVLRRVFRETGQGAGDLLEALELQARALILAKRFEDAELVTAEAVAVLEGLPEDDFVEERAGARHSLALVRQALTQPPDRQPPPPDPAS